MFLLFTTHQFIIFFLPITLFVSFFLAKRNKTWTHCWLILVSMIFYGSFKLKYLLLFFLLTGLNYLMGRGLSSLHQKNKLSTSKKLLAAGLFLNLGTLCYYKYTHFFLENVNTFFHTNFVYKNVLIPLGISFFIFQKIAYLMDCYHGKIKKNYSFLEFLLFVMYFPQLVSGPIVHHYELIPQFHKKEAFQFNPSHLTSGVMLFVIGLFKKMMIADNIGEWVNTSFETLATGKALSCLEAWITALSFTFQIYFDFSGYTDMAIGMAFMMGILLPQNFNSPYQAENIIEFWRRWHMSLSRFLRDYLYIPLGGNRHGKKRRYINLMITMLLGGLWHGSAWTFVIWGGLHGAYLIVNHTWNFFKDRHKVALGSKIFSVLLTFVAVTIAWVFFRAPNVSESFSLLESMIGLHSISFSQEMTTRLLLLSGLLAWVWFLPNSQNIVSIYTNEVATPMLNTQVFRRLYQFLYFSPTQIAANTYLGFTCGILGLFILGLKLVCQTQLKTFIYFQF